MTINDRRRATGVIAWLAGRIYGGAPLAIASSILLSSLAVAAQEDTRRLWDSEFLNKRAPSTSKPRPRSSARRAVVAYLIRLRRSKREPWLLAKPFEIRAS